MSTGTAAAIAARLKKRASPDAAPSGVASLVASRLSKKAKSAPADEPTSEAAAPSAVPSFAEGQQVLGNFKGLGDWDEAVIVGMAADGTYTLDYTDEGLIESGVPASRITPAGGADAVAAAGAVTEHSAVTEPPAAPGSDESGESDSSDDDSTDESARDFIASRRFVRARPGFIFKKGEQGVGYYRDVPLHVKAAEAERARARFNASELAERMIRELRAPPSVRKADAFMELFDLDALRVGTLTDSATQPLFDSLEQWFTAQLPFLAATVPATEVRAAPRVFLKPQQSLRQGLAHPTFAILWLNVACDSEPLSAGLLRRMGMEGRRPKVMYLVVLVRAERNRITQLWVDMDREGVGRKKSPSLDDVLVTDVFDLCLRTARRTGALGALDPVIETQTD